MKARIITISAFSLFCQITHAAVYKCTVDGETTFSQQPCSDDATTVQRVPNVGMGVYEKSLYIAEVQKTAEWTILGLMASMRDSQGCVGREQRCRKFIDSVDSRKMSEIYATLLSDKFNEEDINNIYKYYKDGPAKKEIEIALAELTVKLYPDKPIKVTMPLTEEDIAYREAFFKSNTGKRFNHFIKDSGDEIQKAIQPYLSTLAKQAGLTE